MRVHQMTAALAYGDAVSNDILEIDRRLQAWGFETRIFAEHIEPRLAGNAHHDREYEQFVREEDDLLIYHYSIYNANLKAYVRSGNRKLVIYHNITPAEFFHSYDRGLEAICRAGREALSELQGCDLALGVSDFNRRELVAAGIPVEHTGVLPIFLGLDKFRVAGRNAALYQQLKSSGQTNLLYVGRIAPNKACEDAIKILYAYRKNINPQAHLRLIGHRFLPAYARFLEMLVDRLGLEDAVTFADRVSLSDLRAYYEGSDVFLFTSRHEGFGVPLLESMYFELPILAYSSSAVPETLGAAGVLFNDLAYAEIAEVLHLLVTDAGLRDQIVRRQRERLADFDSAHVEVRLRQALGSIGVL